MILFEKKFYEIERIRFHAFDNGLDVALVATFVHVFRHGSRPCERSNMTENTCQPDAFDTLRWCVCVVKGAVYHLKQLPFQLCV